MRKIIGSLALLLAISTGYAAEQVFLSVQGITGEATQKGREGMMQVLAYSHEIVSPRDPATGQASGRRQHNPLKVVIPQSRSLPPLFQALSQNKVLPKVELLFYKTNVEGLEYLAFTYTLTNAGIQAIRPWMPNKHDASTADYGAEVEVAFTYQKIEWNDLSSATTAGDDWATPIR